MSGLLTDLIRTLVDLSSTAPDDLRRASEHDGPILDLSPDEYRRTRDAVVGGRASLADPPTAQPPRPSVVLALDASVSPARRTTMPEDPYRELEQHVNRKARRAAASRKRRR